MLEQCEFNRVFSGFKKLASSAEKLAFANALRKGYSVPTLTSMKAEQVSSLDKESKLRANKKDVIAKDLGTSLTQEIELERENILQKVNLFDTSPSLGKRMGQIESTATESSSGGVL